MIIDSHAHLWLEDLPASKSKILRLCSEFDVRRVFLSTLHYGVFVPDEEEIRLCNLETVRFMREEPSLIEGLAYINPRNPDCLDVCKRAVEEDGMRGIKSWVSDPIDDPLYNPVCEYAIRADVPLLIHTFYKPEGMLPNESRAYQACILARRYPELKLIIAHTGYNVYDAVPCLYDCPNAYVDLSGSSCRYDDVDYTVSHIGAERVLFGTDMPGSFENCLGQILGANLSDTERRAILYGNAHRLYYRGK